MAITQEGMEKLQETMEFFAHIIDNEGPIAFYKRVLEEIGEEYMTEEIDEEIDNFVMGEIKQYV